MTDELAPATDTEILRTALVGAVAGWLDQQTRDSRSPRINMRTDVVPASAESEFRSALAAIGGVGRTFVVRSSRAADAVEMRNRRNDAGSRLVYVVLWHEGNREHASNAESLRNLHRLDASTILGDNSYIFPLELAVEERVRELCGEASHTREHVLAAWRALRRVLRDQAPAVPLANRVDAWLTYLLQIAPGEALSLDALIERWGAALPALGLFSFPAIGRVLGVFSSCDARPDAEARRREKRWEAELRTELLMSQECTIDFANLADRIAGRGDLKIHLEDLDRRGFRLAQSAPDRARRAFEEFCRTGDRSALSQVEWAWQDAARGATQGVRGVLVQRRLSAPRQDPFKVLLVETTAVLRDTPLVEAVPGQVSKLKQTPDYDSPLRRVLQALADGVPDDAAVASALDDLSIADVPGFCVSARRLIVEDPGISVRAARIVPRWAPRVAEQATVRHPRLLEGLLKVIVNRLDDNGLPPGKLVLQPLGQYRRELRWNLDPAALVVWLAQLMEEEAGDDADGDGASGDAAPIRIQVALQGEDRIVLGEIELAGDEVVPPPEALSAHIGKGAEVRAQSLRLSALQDAWQRYRGSWKSGQAPLAAEADAWVSAWSGQVAAAGKVAAGGAARLSEVKARLLDIADALEAAEEDGSEERATLLRAERTQLRTERLELERAPAAPSAPTIDDETCRELLQVCTSRDDALDPSVLELTPHHPLCLRLRLARERLVIAVIRGLMGTWDASCTPELRKWVDEDLGTEDLPVPLHAYGVVAREPLLFDGWLPSGAARYQRPNKAGEEELSRLGVAPISRVVRDYRQIFSRNLRATSGATDRLQLEIGGDSEGAWAWALIERLCLEPGTELDVGLSRAPTPPARPARLEAAAYGHPDLFGPRRDGRGPRVAFGTRSLRRPHLAVDLGEHLGFRGEFRSRGTAESMSASDDALLFAVPLLRLEGTALTVADPADRLCSAVKALMERVANGQGSTYTYDFDPDQHAERLRGAQGGAHWLVLASRFPVHRAVQLAAQREERQGRAFASLIDFWTTRDRGRPLFVSCSLHAAGDAFRDAALVAALQGLGLSVDLEVVLRAARSVAPKAAIALLRGQYRPEIQGILGLLLTSAYARARVARGRVLALDQHTGLLAGDGQLADLVEVRLESGSLVLRVLEAKFSTRSLSTSDGLGQNGRAQIASTVDRLRHFEAVHLLSARTRRRLVDALVDSATLAGEDDGSDPLVAAALDSRIPIIVESAGSGEVHVWTLDGNASVDRPTGLAQIIVHDRAETLAALSGLASR